MMKLLPALLFTLYSFTAFSQPLADRQNTLLWAVINAKGDTSYLFGTFHEFGSSYFKRYPEVLRKFKEASTCYLEQLTDTSLHSTTSVRQSTKKSWVDQLSRKDYRAINQYLKRLDYDLPLKAMKESNPVEVKYAILQDVLTKSCNIEDANDEALIEEYFFYSASRNGKFIAGLEKSSDSIVQRTYSFVSTSESEKDAVASIVDIARNERRYLDSMYVRGYCVEADNYRSATIDYRFSKLSTSEDPAYSYALDKRNSNWLPTIKLSMNKQKTFIAVGMKHLWYSKGLINLLLRDGYQVVPLAMK